MNPSTEQIEAVLPRKTVEITLPDGRTFSGPRGTLVGTFLRKLPEWDRPPIMGAIVNGELRELTYSIDIESKVQPINMMQADGARIYRRSLTFLLEAAYEELFPEADLAVDYAIASGGFYCEVIGRDPLTKAELAALENKMRDLVKADLPFEREVVPLKDAIEYFVSKGQKEKVRLYEIPAKRFSGALPFTGSPRLSSRLYGTFDGLFTLVWCFRDGNWFCFKIPSSACTKRAGANARFAQIAGDVSTIW